MRRNVRLAGLRSLQGRGFVPVVGTLSPGEGAPKTEEPNLQLPVEIPIWPGGSPGL